MKFVICGDS